MSDTENINDFNNSQVEKEEDKRYLRINDTLNNISHHMSDLAMDNLTPYDIIQDIIDYKISALTHKVSYYLQHNDKDRIYDLLEEIQQYNKIKNILQ